MKKILLPASIVALTFGLNAQVPKYCLLEQFTQASCGPCAAENPGFKTSILDPNPQKVKLIAYHTSWPGTDPMYTFNTGASAARVSFYGVTGVPDVFMMGNLKNGSPSSITQGDVDGVWNTGSPIKMEVTEVDNGTNRDVTVKITSVGAPPAGSYNLYVACIHRNANYTSAPGSNGEKYFPNVFRCMISGNPQTLPSGNANGVAVTLPTQGNSITKGPYNYLESWAINGATTELAAVAWLQNTSTKEIIQCGATFDAPANGIMTSPTAVVVNGTAPQSFNFITGNTGAASEAFTYTLTTNAPANWSANFIINSQTYTNSASLTIPAGTNYNAQINVTPGATPAVGKYTLTMQSTTNPTSPPNTTNVYVISGVTDLIVSNTAGQGDGTGTAAQFEPDYVAGMQFANCTTYGKTDDMVLLRAFQDNAMGQIKWIYWNVAWTFPAIASDNLVAQLTTFLNNGGCLLVSGQDFGWDIWTPAASGGHGTTAQQTFYTNFLNATFVDDGVATTTSISANTSDAIFGTAGTIGLLTNVYTGTSFFPDDITATGIGNVIFNYGAGKPAGVRATNGTYKTVYLAPGIEQMSTAASKNNFLKITYDWFHLATSTEDFDNAMLAFGLGNNFPNPAGDFTYVSFDNLDKNVTLQVMDVTGRVLSENQIVKGTGVFKLNTSELQSGMYLYRVTDGASVSKAKTLQVVH